MLLISYGQIWNLYNGLKEHLRILNAVEKFEKFLTSLEAKDIFLGSWPLCFFARGRDRISTHGFDEFSVVF